MSEFFQEIVRTPGAIARLLTGAGLASLTILITAVLIRSVTRPPTLRRIANSLYLLAFTGSLSLFRWYAPEAFGPKAVPYLRVLQVFSLVYFGVKLLDILLIDVLVARRRKFTPPAILRDLVGASIYFVSLLIIIKEVLHLDLTPIVAGSAIISIIAGLALQETLSNFFAGLALTVERPFEPGDWVKIGDKIGRVTEMSWRAVKVKILDEEDYLIIPNSIIARTEVVNFNQPLPIHGHAVEVGVHYNMPPNLVLRTLKGAALEVEGVLSDPPPKARAVSFGDSGITYGLRYWINDFEHYRRIEGQVLSNIWYAFKRHGIEIPYPQRVVHMHEVTKEEKAEERERETAKILSLLRGVEFLQALGPEELQRVTGALRAHPYQAGKIIVHQGEEGDSFFIIASGRVEVLVRDQYGEERSVATLGRGDCFGEMSLLTGAKRLATVRAAEDTEVLVLGKEEFRPALVANPGVVERLSEILSKRKAETAAELARRQGQPSPIQPDMAHQLLGKIKGFFGLG